MGEEEEHKVQRKKYLRLEFTEYVFLYQGWRQPCEADVRPRQQDGVDLQGQHQAGAALHGAGEPETKEGAGTEPGRDRN